MQVVADSTNREMWFGISLTPEVRKDVAAVVPRSGGSQMVMPACAGKCRRRDLPLVLDSASVSFMLTVDSNQVAIWDDEILGPDNNIDTIQASTVGNGEVI